MSEQQILRLVQQRLDAMGHARDGADDTLELSSLDLVRLLVELEESLDIELDDSAIMNGRLEKLSDVVDLLRVPLALRE